MPHRATRTLAFFLAPALALAVLGACREEPGAAPQQPPRLEYPDQERHQSGVEFPGGLVTVQVGERCVECHEDVVEAYRASAMHDAILLPTGEGSLLASLVGQTVVDEESGIRNRIGVRGGHYTITIFYLDPEGVERASHETRIDLIIGSGHATHSYLQYEGGRMLQLGLTWYREIGRMDLSPGPGYLQRTVRLATRQCIACHTGEVHHVSRDADLGFRGRFSLGVTCERCHGESEEHCLTGDPSTTIHPGRLSVDRQSELCFQCHLTSAITVERDDWAISDFVPGQRLGEFLGVMQIANRDPGQAPDIAGHGERMKLSTCFTASRDASDGMQLTCTTCHNPHRGFKTEGIATETDRGCLVCHQRDACHETEADRQGKACFECHMNTVLSKDIGHTKVTDHWIRRVLPESVEAVSAQFNSPGHLAMSGRPLKNHLDPEGVLPNAHLLKAKAYRLGVELALSIVGQKAEVWARRGLAEIEMHEAEHGSTVETIGLRGRILTFLAMPAEALPYLQQMVAARPDHPANHANLAFALLDLRRDREALTHLENAASLDPFDEVIAGTLADTLVTLGRSDEALDTLDRLRERLGPIDGRATQGMRIATDARKYEQALRYAYDLLVFQSRDPETLTRTGHLCRLAGKPADRARALFHEALKQDPDFVPTLLHLGSMELELGNEREALKHIEHAGRLEPGNPHVLDLMRRAR